MGGSVPTSFGQLTKLTFSGVNRLSRRIHPSIFNLSSLKTFDVGVNQIQGHLPSDIGITLPNIELLSSINNQFTGPIPISISNASNMKILEFSGNKLRGKNSFFENGEFKQSFNSCHGLQQAWKWRGKWLQFSLFFVKCHISKGRVDTSK